MRDQFVKNPFSELKMNISGLNLEIEIFHDRYSRVRSRFRDSYTKFFVKDGLTI